MRFLQLVLAGGGPDMMMTEHTLDDLNTLALRDQLTSARMPHLV